MKSALDKPDFILLRAVTQLGFHQKPVGFLNIAEGNGGSGFYDHLLKFFDTCVDAVSPANAVALVCLLDRSAQRA